MKNVASIENSVMSTEEACQLLTDLYYDSGENYSAVAKLFNINPMTVWRAVKKGTDPSELRSKYKIRKCNRTRACFECDQEMVDWINQTVKIEGIERKDLLVEFRRLYNGTNR